MAGSSVVWAGSVHFGGKLYLLFGRVRSILAGSVLRNSLTSEFNRHGQTDRQTTLRVYSSGKPIEASPRMFSVELWCTGSCFGHAGMVHRGGSINSYGIACSIAIPPLAVGRSVSLINEL